MTEQTLKSYLGISILIIHFAIIFLIFILFLNGGFLFDEMTTTIALVAPTFSSYIFGFVYHATINKNEMAKESPPINGLFIFMSWFLVILISTAIIMIASLKAYNFLSFNQFKMMLTICEISFGAYLSVILSSIYG
ncbi:MAG: hypothetical protein KDC67_09660 [Ignavibacteriae bacterium]|nr:hypothetical protein [Ignavibacteriota bacterium]MCB0748775.1 hypothetical protein [Ignavibacteriota bacterium]